MITTLTRLFGSLLLVVLSVLTLAAHAQDERWYKVELLIFSRTQLANEEMEIWEPTPTLLYPTRYQFLTAPNTPLPNAASIDLNLPIPGPNEPGNIMETAPRPTPFTLLTQSDMAFQRRALQMERSGKYRVLFHQSWLQPMVDKAAASDIVLDHSGDEQQWPELQGSIKFYLSRYLHMETNLWLNTSGDYLPQGWQMPAPPLGPVSPTIKGLELFPGVKDESGIQIGLEEIKESLLESSEEQPTMDLTTAAETPPMYPWRHALLLQQERRMRSTEVHYIDHPAMGVIVLIMPVEEEELLRRAEQQAAQALL